ncbi:NPCBM/NEW2 domain-containing protein, partial [Streptomyces sp. WAC06614]|uniref:NPCBM/NEW2 domain-containing protein n=1 Tax=Streptomyces sp. WAC06614 TaxID=2487416 RepID=UPI000FA1EC62
PTPKPTPPEPAPAGYPLVRIGQSTWGDHSGPEVQTLRSSWVWQRWGLRIADRRHDHGITVNSRSSVEIALNRQCRTFSARVGVDDLSVLSRGRVRFSVYGDGQRLWQSPALGHGDPAVPVDLGIAGHERLRLVVEPAGGQAPLTLASWADAVIRCQ